MYCFREMSEYMYNFTKLSVTLNQEDDEVAPTDSRFRPDQREMENGDWDRANELKLILEDRQRKRKAELDKANKKRVENGKSFHLI